MAKNKSVAVPVDANLFFSRNDPQDVRLGDWAQNSASFKSSFSVLGYPDDEGIKLNGGRVGSALAPNEIRKFFYKMTPPMAVQDRSLLDLGNLQVSDFDLKSRHQEASCLVAKTLKSSKLISLGGGHDYGYPDGAGFLEFCKNRKGVKPLVINFDAHLDVRPLDKGLTSGTPFYRLLNDYEGQFDFVEVGLQPQCNSVVHLEWAQAKKAKTVFMQDIRNKKGGLRALLQSLLPKTRRPLFLSVDIDVFTQSEAPGCSQSWATGLSVAEFWPAYQWLLKSYDTNLLGIYEVSPPLDLDSRTSKLAACIAYEYLFSDQKPGKNK